MRTPTLTTAAAALAAVAAALTAPAPAARAQFTTPNTINTTGPVTTTLNGTTFINQGLQGVGRIAADSMDIFGETFGSVSSMSVTNFATSGAGSYTGTFTTLPDRGYNNASTGFFSDYAARLQQVNFTFTPYTSLAPVPGSTGTEAQRLAAQNQIVANYITGTRLTYGSGNSFTTGLDPGANTTNAFFNRTLPFVPSQTIGASTFPVNKITFDSEGLVRRADGSGYVSDEYAANLYHFNAAGQIDGVITPPPALQPHRPVGTLNFDSVNTPLNGRRENQGLEGVTLSPDGNRLFTLLQSATVQDTGPGQQGRNYTRLLVYDVSNGQNTPGAPVGEYVLKLPTFTRSGNGGALDRTAAQSEIIAISATQFLVLSRDGNGLGSNNASQAVYKTVLLVDIANATNIVGQFDAEGQAVSPNGLLNASVTPLSSAEAVNLLNTAELTRFGFNLNNANPDRLTLSEKFEGLSLVSALDPNAPNDYFLFVANDNDFITQSGFMRQADGTLANYNGLDGDGNGTNDALLRQNDTVFLAYRVTVVPEPGAWAMLLAGGVAGGAILAIKRRRLRAF